MAQTRPPLNQRLMTHSIRGFHWSPKFLALFVTAISKMTFDYRATVKNVTLAFWPKLFFGVNIHAETPRKNLGQKDIVVVFSRQAHTKVPDCHGLFRIL